VRDPRFRGLPWEPPLITGFVRYAATDAVAARLSRAASFRYEGRWVGGEKRKSIDVVPGLSVRLSPELAVFPAGATASREFRVGVTNGERRSSAGRVSLRVPAGWSVSPAAAELRFDGEGAAAEARFTVRAPAGAATDEARITAIASRDAAEFGEGVQVVAYDHIEERHLIRPAVARGLRVDVKVGPGVAVGYVMGVGDQVADAIRQLDVPLQMLSEDDLAFGDLSRYSTIVLGVRAYQARADLRANQRRLMEYAEAGGNLLVQYNRSEFNPKPDAPSPYAPYPARVSTRRVTDETAPMRVLQPEAPVLVSPNRIGARDWEGWVQERGIQLLDATDSRYTDLLAAADPFPKNPAEQKGLLVEARVGRGSWTYCGLVLFRELPAGNPGAYRLLANLISRPRQR
jgi:hypothetical protein